LAHWTLRLASGAVDRALIAAPVWIPYGFMAPGHTRARAIAVGLLAAIALTLLVAYAEGRSGSSPGKTLLRLRLIREENGRPLGFGAALGRRLAQVLDVLACYLGLLRPLWDAKRQTFSDKVVGAVVLRLTAGTAVTW
jgi:uncharacterized RDD family membrane protein YckC